MELSFNAQCHFKSTLNHDCASIHHKHPLFTEKIINISSRHLGINRIVENWHCLIFPIPLLLIPKRKRLLVDDRIHWGEWYMYSFNYTSMHGGRLGINDMVVIDVFDIPHTIFHYFISHYKFCVILNANSQEILDLCVRKRYWSSP